MALREHMHWHFFKIVPGTLEKDIGTTVEEKFGGRDSPIASSLGREPIQNSVDSKLDDEITVKINIKELSFKDPPFFENDYLNELKAHLL